MDANAIRKTIENVDVLDSRLVALTDPTGAAAEQFRMLHLRLDRLREQRRIQVVALTSAVAGEGKSLTVANLAACASRRGRRVALVDCDFRRPAVGRLFGLGPGEGIAQVLSGSASLAKACREGPSNLTLVPTGEPPNEPAGLFSGKGFGEIVEELRSTHDEVYLDLPPILPFADAMVAASIADGVIVVVRNGQTPAEQVEEAVAQLSAAALLGCVLTGCGDGAVAYRKYYARR